MHVYAARWVLPVSAAPAADGAVAVDDAGRIAYAGPRAGAPAGPVTDLGDAALLPGLVDLCGWADGPADPSPDAAEHLVRARLARGVTTIAAPTGSGAVLDALLAVGARGTAYQLLEGPHPGDRAPALAALADRVADMRARAAAVGATARVQIGVAPRALHLVHEDLLLDACAWAVRENLPLAVPAGESPDAVAFLREATGPLANALRARGLPVERRAHSAVHLLAELGIAAVARPLLVGAAAFDASDVALAAYYGCPVAYCPSPGADPSALVALHASAVRLAAAPAVARAALAPHDALTLATLGAARALDLDARLGSLDPGKHADITAVPLDPAADADPTAAALDAMTAGPALLTVVAGHPVPTTDQTQRTSLPPPHQP